MLVKITFNKDLIMKKMSRFTAFTLAETLVTLSIIGLVAALTIPSLKNHADEQKFVALTQKAFSEISAATAQVETQHGNIPFWDWTGYIYEEYDNSQDANMGGPNLVRSWYKKVLNVDNGAHLKEAIPFVDISGKEIGASMMPLGTFVTTDGMCWFVGGISGEPYIFVDVNCSQEPNVMGIDVHSFNVTNDGVLPAGTPGTTNWHGGDAWDCTAYVIKQGKMPWLNKAMDKCPSI